MYADENWAYHACRLGILGVGARAPQLHATMVKGELDASSGCLEGPLRVIIEVVEFQAAVRIVRRLKCSSGAEQNGKGLRAGRAHLRIVREELGRAAAIATPPPASMAQ